MHRFWCVKVLVFLLSWAGSVSVAQAFSYLQGDVTVKGAPFTKSASISLSCNSYTSGGSYKYCYDSTTSDTYGNYNLTTGKSSYSSCCPLKNSDKWDSCQLSAYQWQDQKVGNSKYKTVSFACNSSTVEDLDLPSKDKTIEVTVKAGNEIVTQGINVNCYQNQSPWTSSYITSSTGGVYRVPVTAGTFSCSAYCDWNYWRDDYGNCPYSGNLSTSVTLAETDSSKSAELKFDVKDKTIRLSVYAGSKKITDNIMVSCSQQSSPWSYGSVSKASSDGTYNIKATTGSYYCYSSCKSWPCPTLSGSPHTYVTLANTDSIVDAELYYTVKDKTIKTKIYAGARQIKSKMSVSCNQQGGNWDYSYDQTADADGNYECSVGNGTYSVYAYCSDWQSCDLSGYPQGKVTYTLDDPPDSVASVNLTFLDDNATVAGIVTDGTALLPNVWINFNATQISAQGSAGAVRASVFKNSEIMHGVAQTTQVYASAQTDSRGSFTATLPEGTYTMCAWPPYDRQNLAQSCQEIVAKADGLTSVTFSMNKKEAKISGCVKDDSGNPVRAYVNGWNYGSSTGQYDYFWKQTDSNGCYSVYGIPGYTYNVTASPDTWNNSSATYCGYTNEGMQVITATKDPLTLNFTIPLCDCNLAVSVVSGDDTVVPVSGSINCTRTDLSAGEYYHSNWSWVSSGVGSMKVESDQEYTCDAWFWDSAYTPQSGSICSCSGSSSGCSINVDPVIKGAVSGKFKDESGEIEIPNSSYIYIYATKGKAYRSGTATRSDYTIDLSEGTWMLGYWIDPSSGYASASGGTTTNMVTVGASGKVTQDLVLLSTSSIDVTVNDLDGSARSNVWVECCPYSASQEGANSWQYMYGCGWGESNADGKATIKVGATASPGVDYFCNAYIPFGMRMDEAINNPNECKVSAIVGTTAVCTLDYGAPDGEIAVTVTGEAKSNSGKGKALRAVKDTPPSKEAVNADETETKPCADAAVDCFSPAGGSYETTTDGDCKATCLCTTDDTWYIVAHNLVGNDLYVSEAQEVQCSDGAAEVPMDYVTTVPEAASQTVTDAANQSITLELSDGFSVFFPPGSLGEAGESVTCSADAVVTPFTSNKVPANFYGYYVQCLDSNSVAIHQLKSDATFTMPSNAIQLENMGLSDQDVECTYFDSAAGRYSHIPCTINSEEGNKFSASHLTDFAMVGNGYLGGIQGEDNGPAGKEEAGDAPTEEGGETGSGAIGSAAAGGCSLHQASPAGAAIWLLILVFPFLLTRRYRLLSGRRDH